MRGGKTRYAKQEGGPWGGGLETAPGKGTLHLEGGKHEEKRGEYVIGSKIIGFLLEIRFGNLYLTGLSPSRFCPFGIGVHRNKPQAKLREEEPPSPVCGPF